MDFDYTEDQRHLRDEARRFLESACPLSAVRAVLESPGRGYDVALWAQIAAQGWLGAAIPECYGGLGLSHVELGVIAEEIGAALAPVPFGSTLYLFAQAVTLAGSEEQRATLLPAIAQGELVGCAALLEGPGELDFDRIGAEVRHGRLTGSKFPVVDGDIAEASIVLARDESGLGLFLARLDDPGVARSPLDAVDGSMNVARLDFQAVPVERLPGSGGDMVDTMLQHAAILYAFEQVGGADRCLRLTLGHVRERQAFGGPIGRFQALKHKLADLYVTNELARSHTYHGIWAIDSGVDSLRQAAAAARVAASDAYWLASKEMIHIHGAMGFSWDHDSHLFYRRAHHLSLVVGGPGWWKDVLFDTLAVDATKNPCGAHPGN